MQEALLSQIELFHDSYSKMMQDQFRRTGYLSRYMIIICGGGDALSEALEEIGLELQGRMHYQGTSFRSLLLASVHSIREWLAFR